jgi:integrase
MKREEILTQILQGKKFANKALKAKYITAKNGQIVDDTGKNINIMQLTADGWYEYKESKTYKKDEVILKLFTTSKKFTNKALKSKYIMVKNGQIVDDTGKIVDITNLTADGWYEYKDSEINIEELKKEIEIELREKIKKEFEELEDEIEKLKNKLAEKNITIKKNIKKEYDAIKILYGASDWETISNNFVNELNNAKNKEEEILTVAKYIPFCFADGKNINTAKRYFTDFKNLIDKTQAKAKDFLKKMLTFEKKVYVQINEIADENVKQKVEAQELYSKNLIDEELKKINEMIETENFELGRNQTKELVKAYLEAIYLALVSGRRQAEILKTMKIEKKEDGYYYTGLTKGSKDVKAKFYFDNNVDKLNNMLADIRKTLKTHKLNNKQINDRYSKSLNSAIKKYTNLDVSFHDLREIWADILYKLDAVDESEEEYKSKILGHIYKPKRLSATEHYMTKKQTQNDNAGEKNDN